MSEEWSPLEWKFLIMKCLNERWNSFIQRNDVAPWYQEDFITIANKCPNLKKLRMGMDANLLQSWPMLPAPWTSLQDLTIQCPQFGNVFEGVELHLTLPNLIKIWLHDDRDQDTEPSFLPDLEGCDQLEIAIFFLGFCRFNGDVIPGDGLPLPQGLRTLNIRGCRFHEEFMNRITYEDIKKVLPGLQNFGNRRHTRLSY